MFILLFVGGSLGYQTCFLFLFFTKPLQANIVLSLYLCWSLWAYATILMIFMLSQSLYLYFYVYIIIRGR